MKSKAFTMAEVLITLGIIGIVASMTMPSMIKNYRHKVLVTELQRVMALLNNVMIAVRADHGEIKYLQSASPSFFIKNYMQPYLESSKFVSESDLSKMKIYSKDGNYVFLNGGWASGLKLKTGELIRVVNGFDPQARKSMQIGVVLHQSIFNKYYIGKDYFTFILDIEKGTVGWQDIPSTSYTCKTNKEQLVKWCGMYGHDPACFALLSCNNWKVPEYYPVKI